MKTATAMKTAAEMQAELQTAMHDTGEAILFSIGLTLTVAAVALAFAQYREWKRMYDYKNKR